MKATLNIRREQIQRFRIENYNQLSGGFHFHSPIELIWVRRGAVNVWINDIEGRVNENELAIVLSYEAHQFVSDSENGEYTILFVSTDMCQEFVDIVQHKKIHNPIIHDQSVMKKIGYAINILTDEKLNTVEQAGYIHIILGMILKQSEFERANVRSEAHLPSNLLFYINEHFKEDISIATIAQELGYNKHYLSKSFRSEFRIGINDYINTLRLKNAIILMRQKDKCVTDCAMESGFSSLRTFYRIFKDEFGCTPREYMQQL